MRAERGFTLLEVLVAFAIAALALGLLFRTASGGLLQVRTAGRYEEAVARARSHLAALGRDAGVSAGESEGDDGGGFRWHLRVEPLASAAPAPQGGPGSVLTAAPSGPVLYAVAVAISWNDAGRRTVTLDSQRLGTAADDGP